MNWRHICRGAWFGASSFVCIASAFTPADRIALQEAVDEWLNNQTRFEAEHGHIRSWDTSM
eukprot:5885957-Amphidinium_carterae.2